MPTWTEMLGDGAKSGEEPLSMPRGLKPLHTALSLASGLVRVLRAMIEIPRLPMFHPWQDLALGGAVALEFVSNDHPRYVR
jgi:hypothetical protein